MVETVGQVMKRKVTMLPAAAGALEAARMMRDDDIGAVLVLDDKRLLGIVTDRDIVVRCLAEGRDPARVRVGEICSRDLALVSPGDSVTEAVRLMSQKAVRRLPVLRDGRPVGIVSIGDLAVLRDRHSALGNISAAPANH